MAYGNRYYAGWHNSGIKGYVYIDQFDYVGGAEKLQLIYNGISIAQSFEDWNNPIMGLRCDLEIVNDRADYFELMSLLLSEEREFRIRVTVINPASTIFEGFINCDTITQKYLNRQTIRFTASSYLSKLDNDHPSSVDVIQTKVFINLIDEILRTTGAEFNIRINSKIHAEGDVLSAGQTLFNKNGCNTEVFWEDDVERKTSMEILKVILTTFDCYIYWWNGYWYIERYEDIWLEGDVTFNEYTTNVTYQPNTAGAVVTITKTVQNLHDILFVNQSQTQHVIPGLKSIQINLEDLRLMNLVYGDLAAATDHTGNFPVPAYRKWLSTTDNGISWTDRGLPKSVIKNSIRRLTPLLGGVRNKWEGLYTNAKVTVEDEVTELNISYKLIIPKRSMDGTDGWKKYTFQLHWYIRVMSPTVGTNFITQSGDDWLLREYTSEESATQVMIIDGGSFDPFTNVLEVSITIPIGKVVYTDDTGVDRGQMRGDYDVVMGFGTERITSNDTDDIPFTSTEAWFGDFLITTTGNVQPNVIEGKVNSKFLNKKEIPLLLYDMESYNYKNGILRGDDLTIRTERWGTLGGQAHIKEKGLCYSTVSPPTVAHSKLICGTGYEPFTGKITGLTYGTTYHVRAYGIDEDGTAYYGEERTFATDNLVVGSPYQGGIIAYIFPPTEPAYGDRKGYVADHISGIVCAREDVKFYNNSSDWWGSLSTPHPVSPGAFEYEIGFAEKNTLLINDNPYQYIFACAKVMAYEVKEGAIVWDDWFWPTLNELWMLRSTRYTTSLPGFTNSWYWSSTELSGSVPPHSNYGTILVTQEWKKSWALNFNSQTSKCEWYNKSNVMRVRPIHYFSTAI